MIHEKSPKKNNKKSIIFCIYVTNLEAEINGLLEVAWSVDVHQDLV